MNDEIERCRRCILPASLPSVTLDDEGVCQHCRLYAARFEQADPAKGEAAFARILERARSRQAEYDALIPLSGGKDSTFALYLCARVHGLKCLCVTFENGFLSDFARGNIRRAVEISGADHLMYTVNRKALLKVYGAFMHSCGAFCPACMRGIERCKEMAVRMYRIPLVVSGTGARVTYLNQHPEVFQGGDYDFFASVVRESGCARAAASLDQRTWRTTFRTGLGVVCRKLHLPGPHVPEYLNLYDYITPDLTEMQRILHEEMGWQAPCDHVEHMDCEVHAVAAYLHALKRPEITPQTLHLSGLVRMGEMTRDEALAADAKVAAETTGPPAVLDAFVEQLGMPREEFLRTGADWQAADRHRNGLSARVRQGVKKLLGRG